MSRYQKYCGFCLLLALVGSAPRSAAEPRATNLPGTVGDFQPAPTPDNGSGDVKTPTTGPDQHHAHSILVEPIIRLEHLPDLGDDVGNIPTTDDLNDRLGVTPVSRCPDSVVGATAGSKGGYDYYAFDPGTLCPPIPTGVVQTYCFQNPNADASRSDLVDRKMVIPMMGGSWSTFVQIVTGFASQNTDACYICSCLREGGCFPPGVKITMADGLLRNIEDVHAGEAVQNAKTGAPMKVGKVIEGPEALPLIRFGFEGTTVTTSQAHPVLTAAGLKPANLLTKADTVFDAQGKSHALTILETLPVEEGQRVINVDLETGSSDMNDRLLISDGIITGDLILQGLLQERK